MVESIVTFAYCANVIELCQKCSPINNREAGFGAIASRLLKGVVYQSFFCKITAYFAGIIFAHEHW